MLLMQQNMNFSDLLRYFIMLAFHDAVEYPYFRNVVQILGKELYLPANNVDVTHTIVIIFLLYYKTKIKIKIQLKICIF